MKRFDTAVRGRATRRSIIYCFAPQRKTAKVPSNRPYQRLGTRGGQPQIMIGLLEQGHLDARRLDVFDCVLQVCLSRNPQHNQIARFFLPGKPPASLDTGVPYLDDLLRQGNISSNQYVSIREGWLVLRHECPHGLMPGQELNRL